MRFKRLCAALVVGLSAVGLVGVAGLRAGENGERRLQMFNIHTEESIDIVYKKDGQYIPEALEKLNHFMRDWRASKEIKMDPHTIDLVWEIHEELGSKEPVHLICGYRSSGTNEALRRAGGGQAQKSQHILGKAMDVAFPDVPVQKLRYAGLVREAGGVGYYPTSGVPFVHIDSGTVRMWPRMPRYELALLFPSGHSKFVPADGRPISISDVSYARGHYTQMAEAIAAFHQFRGAAKDRTLIASIEATQPPEPEAATPPEPDTTAEAVPTPVQTASLTPALAGPALKPAKTGVVVKTGVVIKATKPVIASVTLARLPSPIPPRPTLAVRPVGTRPADGLAVAATVSARAQGAEEIVPPEPQETASADPAFMDKAGWVSAPDYDEDHDSELSYRPFPLAGLIEAVPSIDNPVLSKFTRPDLAAAHQSIGTDDGIGMGMQFRQSLQMAETIWTDEYSATPTVAGAGSTGTGRLVHTASAD